MYPFHNDIVICSDRLYRLLGIASDDEDYYYICQEMHGKIIWNTAVVYCESIKVKIDDTHYKSIDATFELNGSPKTEKFYVEFISNLRA